MESVESTTATTSPLSSPELSRTSTTSPASSLEQPTPKEKATMSAAAASANIAAAAAAAAAAASMLDMKPKVDVMQNNNNTQKIKKCALKSKNLNLTKITRKSAKSLRKPKITTTTIKTIAKTIKSSTRRAQNRATIAERQQQLERQQQQLEFLYPQTKEKFLFTLDLLAVVRRNASDKLKLIQMVHDNPILWDSRLPNFKGAEEEKNRAWEYIGKEFNAPGRRVARAFKSLRESYRRELAHVKLMGSGFKPKWSLYEAMDFLRDVIRERKGGSHAAEQAAIGLNLSALTQHMHHNSNNNNNLSKSIHKINTMHSSPFNEAALNLSKCSALNMSQDDYYYFVKPEMDLSNQNGSNTAADGQQQQQQPHHHHHHHQQQQQQQHPLPAHQQQLQQQHHNMQNDTCVSSTRNDCTQNSTSFDDMDASSLRSADEASLRNATALSREGSDEIEELEAIDADFPYPLILDSNSARGCAGGAGVPGGGINGGAGSGHHNGVNKRKRKSANGEAGGDIDDIDDIDDCDGDYEGQMLQQHRHIRQQQNLGNLGGGGGGIMGGSGMGMDMPQPQTVREVLNSKFCGFISAKLNSMEDTEADNLMNKILMLLVQTQGNDLK